MLKKVGSIFKKVSNKLYGIKEANILMFGLAASGKTTILYKLLLGECQFAVPTKGINEETIHFKKTNFTILEHGPNYDGLYQYLHYHFPDTNALIFVFDSYDRSQIQLARNELHRILVDENLKNVPLLVLANKQDLGVMSVDEVTKELHLNTIIDRDWHCLGTSGLSGDGLAEGLDWLSNSLRKK